MPIRPPARDLWQYQDRYLVDLVENSYRQEVSSNVGHLLAMAMVLAFKGDHLPVTVLVAWPAALLLGCALRLVLLHRHRARNPRQYRRAHLAHHAIGVGLCAAAWSGGFLACMPYFTVADIAFLMMVFAGLTAGAVITLAPRLRTYVIFVGLTLGPPTFTLLFSGVASFREIGAMSVLFVLFCSKGVRASSIASRAAMLRRYQNQDYVRDLATAKAELEQAWRRSEDANQAKQQFLANISHEVRTPLNGILGMTALVLDEPLEDAQRDHMRTLKRCGENLLHLVDDLLDFSRIEAGRMEIEEVEIDLRELAAQLVEEHGLQARRKGGIEVRLEWADGAPERIIGDPVRLRQVLYNLLANAVKFTAHGAITLRVWRNRSVRGEQLVLQVADQGIGIPEERREAIFESFTQADGTTTRNYGGSGLGLAICRQLVELMDGCITLQSEVGVGSTFTIDLPLRMVAERTGSPPVQILLAGDYREHVAALHEAGWDATCCAFDAELWMEARRLFRYPEARRVLLCSTEDLQANRSLIEALQRHTECEVVVAGAAPERTAAHTWNPDDGAAALLALFPGPEPVSDEDGERGPLTVLVAEDDETNALLMRTHLENGGHVVHVARDGAEAVRMFRVLLPDLVFMDCQMPVMDGLEATRQIRALDGGARVPIVAVSAHDRPADRERFAAAGMSAYLAKPFDRRGLDTALQSASRHPTAEAQAS